MKKIRLPGFAAVGNQLLPRSLKHVFGSDFQSTIAINRGETCTIRSCVQLLYRKLLPPCY